MSDTQSAPCGVGGFGFVPIAIDYRKIPDELRGDVLRLLDRLGIANAYIDELEASLATLDDENKGLAARVAELEARCKRLEEAGDAIVDEYMVAEPEKSAWRQAKEAKP